MPEHVKASSPKRTESGRIAGVTFSSQSISRRGWARSWRPLWCCVGRVQRAVADMPKGVTLFPGGLVPSTSVKSQPCPPSLSMIATCDHLEFYDPYNMLSCLKNKHETVGYTFTQEWQRTDDILRLVLYYELHYSYFQAKSLYFTTKVRYFLLLRAYCSSVLFSYCFESIFTDK